MATVAGPSKQNAKYDTFVEAQLEKARKRIRTLDVMTALLGFAAGTLAYAVLMALLDNALTLPPAALHAGFFLYLAAALVYLGVTIVRPLTARINPYFAAKQVEQTLPGSKNSVVNWLDLHADDTLPSAIHGAVSQRAARDLSQADLEKAVSGRRAGWVGGAVAALFVVFLVLLFALGGRKLFSHLGRAFLPFSGQSVATRTEIVLLEPESGNFQITAGQAFTVRARVNGRVPRTLKLITRPTKTDPEQEQSLDPDKGAPGEWVVTVPASDVKNGFFYRVIGGDASTEEYYVEVRSTPALLSQRFTATYRARAYTGQKVARVERQKRTLEDLRGTTVTLDVPTNRTLKKGQLELLSADGKERRTIPAQIVAARPTALRVQFVLEKSSKYIIRFTSTEGEDYADAGLFDIIVRDDTAPAVVLKVPGRDETLAANALLKLEGTATDDIGVKEMMLRLKVVDGTTLAAKPYRSPDALRLADNGYPNFVEYKDFLDLGQVKDTAGKLMVLQPGTVLEYWLEARDACDYPKPNVGASQHFKVTIGEPQGDKQKQEQERQQANKEQQEHEKKQDQELKNEKQKRQDKTKEQEKEKEKPGQGANENQQGQQGDGQASKTEAGKGKPPEQTPEQKQQDEDLKKKDERLKEAVKKAEEERKKEQDKKNQQEHGTAKDDGQQQKPGSAKGDPNKEKKQDQQDPPDKSGKKEANGKGKDNAGMKDGDKANKAKPSNEKDGKGAKGKGKPEDGGMDKQAASKDSAGMKDGDKQAQGKDDPQPQQQPQKDDGRSTAKGNKNEKQDGKQNTAKGEGTSRPKESKGKDGGKPEKSGQAKADKKENAGGKDGDKQAQAKDGKESKPGEPSGAEERGAAKGQGQGDKKQAAQNKDAGKEGQQAEKSKGKDGGKEQVAEKKPSAGKGEPQQQAKGQCKQCKGGQSAGGAKPTPKDNTQAKAEQKPTGGQGPGDAARAKQDRLKGDPHGKEALKKPADQATREDVENLARDLKSDDPKTRRDAERKLDEVRREARKEGVRQEAEEKLGEAKGGKSQATVKKGPGEGQKPGGQKSGPKQDQKPVQAKGLGEPKTKPGEEKADRGDKTANRGKGKEPGGMESDGSDVGRESGARGPQQAAPLIDPKEDPDDGRFKDRAGILQLEKLDPKMRKKVLEEAGLTEEDVKLLRDRFERTPPRASDPTKDPIARDAKGNPLKTTGPERVRPGTGKGVESNSDGLPPREYRGLYRKFTKEQEK